MFESVELLGLGTDSVTMMVADGGSPDQEITLADRGHDSAAEWLASQLAFPVG